MTLDDLREAMLAVRSGQYIPLSYDIFSEMFPPGEPDDVARARAYAFAKAQGFRIENKPDAKQVWFIRD